jgi:hypothetical protein
LGVGRSVDAICDVKTDCEAELGVSLDESGVLWADVEARLFLGIGPNRRFKDASLWLSFLFLPPGEVPLEAFELPDGEGVAERSGSYSSSSEAGTSARFDSRVFFCCCCYDRVNCGWEQVEVPDKPHLLLIVHDSKVSTSYKNVNCV